MVATAKSLQSCPTLCDPIDSSPPGCSVPGILQARILEWVAISFSDINWNWWYCWESWLEPGCWLQIPTARITWWILVYGKMLALDFAKLYSYPQIVMKESEIELLSHVWLFATPWTVARQALLSMGFSKQEYWIGLPFPSPGDLPDRGIRTPPRDWTWVSCVAGGFFIVWATGKVQGNHSVVCAFSSVITFWLLQIYIRPIFRLYSHSLNLPVVSISWKLISWASQVAKW